MMRPGIKLGKDDKSRKTGVTIRETPSILARKLPPRVIPGNRSLRRMRFPTSFLIP